MICTTNAAVLALDSHVRENDDTPLKNGGQGWN